MENNYEIYKITNQINNKVYIGQTRKGYLKRWAKHKYQTHRNSPLILHNAIRKYGTSAFQVEVIAHAINSNTLNDLEILLIAQYDSLEKGYNMTAGGESTIGYKHTDETKKKFSKIHKGKKLSEAHVNKIIAANTGRKLSEEHKRKLFATDSRRMLGKKHSEETKKKMGLTKKGNKYALGLKRSKETKMRMSAAQTGRLNHQSKGPIHTPFGIFETCKEAAKALKCHPSTIGNRCNSSKNQWDHWFFQK